ncbi:MAG: DUF4445 domain-containing protein [Clostridia bacterium]|nr:DUF4445 domain-containing protein [Clostridia bacterium]
MVSVTIRNEKGLTKKTFSDRILLADALDLMGHPVKKPCGGKGICGRCKVKAAGTLNPPAQNGYVFACESVVAGEVYVDLTGSMGETESVSGGIMPHFPKNPLIDSGYGAAIDIGTTTIAAYIYNFPECKLVKTILRENPQTRFGADVLTRIEFAGDNLSLLSSSVRNTISEMLSGYDIKKTVITGNTVMLHLYSGLDPSGLAEFPFEPKSLFGEWYGDSYIMPCISPYVGADITAAIISSDMTKNKTALLLDLGTNGEMVLWSDGQFAVCSTAAGPAFEAVGIKNGCSSVPGAINHVTHSGFTTISDKPPIGICGSGLVDIVALLLDSGKLDSSGYLKSEFEIPGSNIFVFPDDIRLFQLAKSAIRSGLDCLTESNGLSYDDIDSLYIAGGMGSFIDADSAVKTGIIPHSLASKTKILGNAAGMGASMLLLNKDFTQHAQQIIKSATVLELAGNDNFTQKYLKNMYF